MLTLLCACTDSQRGRNDQYCTKVGVSTRELHTATLCLRCFTDIQTSTPTLDDLLVDGDEVFAVCRAGPLPEAMTNTIHKH